MEGGPPPLGAAANSKEVRRVEIALRDPRQDNAATVCEINHGFPGYCADEGQYVSVEIRKAEKCYVQEIRAVLKVKNQIKAATWLKHELIGAD
jgi:hypothetical protein